MIICTITDCKYKKIPNLITFPFMLIGVGILIFYKTNNFESVQIFPRIMLFIMIFILGATNLIGKGDIKLLMGVSLINSPIAICLSLATACLFFIIYIFIKNPKEANEKIFVGLIEIKSNQKTTTNITMNKNKAIPFVPYLLAGYLIIQILRYAL